jgi:hypothetical protein
MHMWFKVAFLSFITDAVKLHLSSHDFNVLCLSVGDIVAIMSPRSPSGSGSGSGSTISEGSLGIGTHAPIPGRKAKGKPPQDIIDAFWAKFITKYPGKATTVIPPYKHARIKEVSRSGAHEMGAAAQASYDQAAALCRDKVEKIIQECRRVNKRYRDL